MEIKHLRIKEKNYSYTLFFITTEEFIVSFFDGFIKAKEMHVKILSYDLSTGFMAFSINNKVTRAIVESRDKFMVFLLQFPALSFEYKKLNVLQHPGSGAFNVDTYPGESEIQDLVSPLSGRLIQLFIKKGDFIKKDSPLLVIESMKMENVIYASRDSVIKNVFISIGDLVKQNQKLVGFKQAGDLYYGASQTTAEF